MGRVMQPIILDVRGNPLEDYLTRLTDILFKKTVVFTWNEKPSSNKIDLSSIFESIAKECK